MTSPAREVRHNFAMGRTRKIISFLLVPFLRHGNHAAPGGSRQGLLALGEKRELETLLREKLLAYYDRHGAASLLQPGVFVVVEAQGCRIQQGAPAAESCLASVETCTLPAAVALLAIGQREIVVPRNVVKFFGTEAASALAAAINRLPGDPPSG